MTSSGLLELVSSTLISYDITHSTHAKCLCPQFFILRASRLLVLVARQAARPDLLDLLPGVHDLDDRSVVENFCQSWTARLGLYHSDLQSLRLVQDRRAAVVVDSFDADSFREHHHRDHSFNRSCEELRQRGRLRDWFDFAGNYFLPDSRLWQRAISRTSGCTAGNLKNVAARQWPSSRRTATRL
jgi:hypothetical protein